MTVVKNVIFSYPSPIVFNGPAENDFPLFGPGTDFEDKRIESFNVVVQIIRVQVKMLLQLVVILACLDKVNRMHFRREV